MLVTEFTLLSASNHYEKIFAFLDTAGRDADDGMREQ